MSVREAWAGFWHRPESARNLAVARILLAGSALWVVLSRADLPAVLALPPEMWAGVSAERRWRFGLVFGLGPERALFGLLHLTLLGALLGVVPRLSCLLSGLLLYHFAPLETLIRTPNPYLRGLTLPTLGLLVLACAPCLGDLALWPRPSTWPTRFCSASSSRTWACSCCSWTGAGSGPTREVLEGKGCSFMKQQACVDQCKGGYCPP